MANTPQYSCLENPFLTEKSGRSQSTGPQRVGNDQSDPVCIKARHFFFFLTCGSSAPVRVEHEGDAASWLAGTLVAPSVQGHGLPLPQESWPYQSLFRASCSWRSECLFDQSFSIAPPIQALRGLRCLGSFSVVLHFWHIEGPPWLGSCSVDWHISCLKEHPGWDPIL